MKKLILLTVKVVIAVFYLHAQGVTQLNNNNSLQVHIPLSNGKTILTSDIDSTMWSTDANPDNTIQLSPVIRYNETGAAGLLSNKFIFRGSTPVTGSEVYISDGTQGGTVLLKDINPGTGSADPRNFTLLNGFLYFTANDGSHGRELWRTNGTSAGTTLVKDIEPGVGSSFNIAMTNNLFSNGSFLFFAANTTGSGNELWKSDGTDAGTVLLKEINTGNGNADSSNPREFYRYNNKVLFLAKESTHGEELWATDGSGGGTGLVKDINPGVSGSTTSLFLGSSIPVFKGFHSFNNLVYLNAYDGASTGEIWSTDGTTANTFLLKDVVHSNSISLVSVIDAENLPGKFIFPVSNLTSRSELWESDGTPAGTQLFKSFSVVNGHRIPFIFSTVNIDFNTQSSTQPLFQGNKFFFVAATTAEGAELWVSDGTLPGTNMVKDIFVGAGDGIDATKSISFLYTLTAFYFAATDGTNGDELWKTDGTGPGSSIVADINPNAADANPNAPIYLCNNKIIFTATDGDDVTASDLFVVNGNFSPLPVKLTYFTVTPLGNDAVLQWSTQQEMNCQRYIVQRGYDGQQFEDIGNVNAAGTVDYTSKYAFTDHGIRNSGKPIVYYRLHVMDKDGGSSFSKIIYLKMKGNSDWNLRLLSNPVIDYVNLMLTDVSGSLQLTVRDMSGRMVYTSSMNNVNGLICLPVLLPKGIYLLEAVLNNERKTIRFIK